MRIGRKTFTAGFKLFDLFLMVVSFAIATLPQYQRVGRFGTPATQSSSPAGRKEIEPSASFNRATRPGGSCAGSSSACAS